MLNRLLLIGALLVPTVATGATASDVATSIESFYVDKKDIRALFTQEVRKPGRRRVIRKSGKVFFKRPGQMRWDYRKPERIHYISDGKVLWSYQAEDALVTRLDVHNSELYHQTRYLFGQGNLRSDFELSLSQEVVDGQVGLVLTPKRKSRDFKTLTLWVASDSGEIRSTVLIDPYDNESRVTFATIQYKVLDETVFEFTPPKGVTVRDLSKQGRTSP